MNDTKNQLAGAALASIMLILYACSGQNGSKEQDSSKGKEEVQYTQGEPVILFDTLEHDFGTIIEGERVVCYFDYENGGGGDLLITAVEVGCGCTIPAWSKEPLQPGGNETLELIFDASGRSGEQRKLITVKSNASEQEVRLTIRANVTSKV